MGRQVVAPSGAARARCKELPREAGVGPGMDVRNGGAPFFKGRVMTKW